MKQSYSSSIVDIPRKKEDDDFFGIEKYQEALVDFMEHASTPLTIALQGEWGSGKTSLMNLLDLKLCDSGKFHRVWINSWQYSLMRTPEEAIIKIVSGIVEQILKTYEQQDKKSMVVSKLKTLIKKAAIGGGKFMAKQIVDKVGGNAEFVDDLFSGDGSEGAEISEMKIEIGKLIKEILDKDNSKNGFIFFIDDLDRIDPPVAVQILELLKNIFDLDRCIFILAIDYDVVIKGLEPKFGKLSDQNEREFRSFFDKIIQLPFSMPVAAYSIDNFLINALIRIGYLDEKESSEPDIKIKLSEMARLSVGQNPRALKRLTNTLSLINVINRLRSHGEANPAEKYEKLVGFALVCLQIAYPLVYNKLLDDPAFNEWNENTAIRLRMPKLTQEQLERLENTEEFDEDWEKVLFQICQKQTYSSNRVFQISSLMNTILDLIPEKTNTGGIIAGIIEQSAITNLQAFDKPQVIIGKRSEIQKNLKEILQLKLPLKLKKPLVNEIKILTKSDDGRLMLRVGTDRSQLKNWWMHEIHILVSSRNEGVQLAIDFLVQRWPASIDEFISLHQKIFRKCADDLRNLTKDYFGETAQVEEEVISKSKAGFRVKAILLIKGNLLTESNMENLLDYISGWAEKTVTFSLATGENKNGTNSRNISD